MKRFTLLSFVLFFVYLGLRAQTVVYPSESRMYSSYIKWEDPVTLQLPDTITTEGATFEWKRILPDDSKESIDNSDNTFTIENKDESLWGYQHYKVIITYQQEAGDDEEETKDKIDNPEDNGESEVVTNSEETSESEEEDAQPEDGIQTGDGDQTEEGEEGNGDAQPGNTPREFDFYVFFGSPLPDSSSFSLELIREDGTKAYKDSENNYIVLTGDNLTINPIYDGNQDDYWFSCDPSIFNADEEVVEGKELTTNIKRIWTGQERTEEAIGESSIYYTVIEKPQAPDWLTDKIEPIKGSKMLSANTPTGWSAMWSDNGKTETGDSYEIIANNYSEGNHTVTLTYTHVETGYQVKYDYSFSREKADITTLSIETKIELQPFNGRYYAEEGTTISYIITGMPEGWSEMTYNFNGEVSDVVTNSNSAEKVTKDFTLKYSDINTPVTFTITSITIDGEKYDEPVNADNIYVYKKPSCLPVNFKEGLNPLANDTIFRIKPEGGINGAWKFSWKIDGKEVSTEKELSIEQSKYQSGNVSVEVKHLDNTIKEYSFSFQFKIGVTINPEIGEYNGFKFFKDEKENVYRAIKGSEISYEISGLQEEWNGKQVSVKYILCEEEKETSETIKDGKITIKPELKDDNTQISFSIVSIEVDGSDITAEGSVPDIYLYEAPNSTPDFVEDKTYYLTNDKVFSIKAEGGIESEWKYSWKINGKEVSTGSSLTIEKEKYNSEENYEVTLEVNNAKWYTEVYDFKYLFIAGLTIVSEIENNDFNPFKDDNGWHTIEGSTVTYKINVPEDWNGNNIEVYYSEEDAKVTKKVANGEIAFEKQLTTPATYSFHVDSIRIEGDIVNVSGIANSIYVYEKPHVNIEGYQTNYDLYADSTFIAVNNSVQYPTGNWEYKWTIEDKKATSTQEKFKIKYEDINDSKEHKVILNASYIIKGKDVTWMAQEQTFNFKFIPYKLTLSPKLKSGSRYDLVKIDNNAYHAIKGSEIQLHLEGIPDTWEKVNVKINNRLYDVDSHNDVNELFALEKTGAYIVNALRNGSTLFCIEINNVNINVFNEPKSPQIKNIIDNNRGKEITKGIREGNTVKIELNESPEDGFPGGWKYEWKQDDEKLPKGEINQLSRSNPVSISGNKDTQDVQFSYIVSNKCGDVTWLADTLTTTIRVYRKPKTPSKLEWKGNGTSNTLIATYDDNGEYKLVFGDGNQSYLVENERWTTKVSHDSAKSPFVYAIKEYDSGVRITSDACYIDKEIDWDGSTYNGETGFSIPTRSTDETTTAIQEVSITNDDSSEIMENYSISGMRQNQLVRGINIIRMKDGSVKKMYKK